MARCARAPPRPRCGYEFVRRPCAFTPGRKRPEFPAPVLGGVGVSCEPWDDRRCVRPRWFGACGALRTPWRAAGTPRHPRWLRTAEQVVLRVESPDRRVAATGGSSIRRGAAGFVVRFFVSGKPLQARLLPELRCSRVPGRGREKLETRSDVGNDTAGAAGTAGPGSASDPTGRGMAPQPRGGSDRGSRSLGAAGGAAVISRGVRSVRENAGSSGSAFRPRVAGRRASCPRPQGPSWRGTLRLVRECLRSCPRDRGCWWPPALLARAGVCVPGAQGGRGGGGAQVRCSGAGRWGRPRFLGAAKAEGRACAGKGLGGLFARERSAGNRRRAGWAGFGEPRRRQGAGISGLK